MAIVGLLLFLRLEPGGRYLVDLLPAMILVSIGMGLTFVPVTLIATSGIPHDDAGLASGLFNTSQQIGGALGLAILSTLAASATAQTMGSATGPPTGQALVDGFHVAFLGSAVAVAIGAVLLAVLLRRSDVVAVGEGVPEPSAAQA